VRTPARALSISVGITEITETNQLRRGTGGLVDGKGREENTAPGHQNAQQDSIGNGS
jgi:hypothetical protein